ncbi:CWF19-like protein 1 [Oscarella lobularis]|uniref:CWF19-like protein 1 n=1 Tax=Oscarella lobularis TaxID=121494 RepID=UPI00331430FE
MAAPLKVLVAGDVNGRFDLLFGRVRTILKKSGQFEMLLCIGNFFGSSFEEAKWSQYKDGSAEVPLPTYILGPVSAEQVAFYGEDVENGKELCTNLTYLGRRGFFTLSGGLQIAYLSGLYNEETYPKSEREDPVYFHRDDIDHLLSRTVGRDFAGVDLFISSEWPSGVFKFTAKPEKFGEMTVGSSPLAQLAKALKPRYHFAAMLGMFYERSPYRNHKVLQESQTHVSRFIALANADNGDKKERYLYAFNIVPMTAMKRDALIAQPQNATECPYGPNTDEKQHSRREQPQSYFFDTSSSAESRKRSGPHESQGPRSKQHKPPVPQGPCWFCLGSPEVERHLIVSVGENCYLALPKGGLVSEHTLILPIGHYRSSLEVPQEVSDEAEKFKRALRQYYQSKRQTLVIFERNFHSPHLQFQAVPITGLQSDELREIFKAQGMEQGIDFIEVPRDGKLKDFITPNVPFFHVEFDNGERLLHRIRGRFPVQFGREVLASRNVLDAPERIDWKSCAVSKDKETQMATRIRRNFQPFDFTREL